MATAIVAYVNFFDNNLQQTKVDNLEKDDWRSAIDGAMADFFPEELEMESVASKKHRKVLLDQTESFEDFKDSEFSADTLWSILWLD